MSGHRSEQIVAKTEAAAELAMVCAEQPAAADAALAVLAGGGNAVDAAVTAAFVAGVAEPAMSGIGGIAAMIIRLPDGRETVIDGGSGAPLGSRADMFPLDPHPSRRGMYGWPATLGNANNVGPLSVGVPGMPAAMALALQGYGTIGLADALRPAISLARHGFEVDPHLAIQLAGYADRLWPFPEARRTFFRADGLPLRPALGLEPGDRLVQEDLATTLGTMASQGVSAFYRGTIAHAVVDDVRANGGVLSADDLKAYRARELSPLVTDHRGHRVATMPMLGGGVTLVQALNAIAGVDLDDLERSSRTYVHLLAELGRMVFRDRFGLLGDPDHVAAPFARLVSAEHAQRTIGAIDPDRAHPEIADLSPGAVADGTHTTHLCVVDADRMCVSLSSSLGQGFGSGVVPRGTGIVLADVMTWFDPRPGWPNSIAPGKRVLSALAPTIVSRMGRPRLVVGALGGRKLITAVLQTILNVIDHGDGPQAAVNAARVHGEGRETWVDGRIAADVREELARMGHELVVRTETISASPFGRSNAIAIGDRELRGGVSTLKPATAVGR